MTHEEALEIADSALGELSAREAIAKVVLLAEEGAEIAAAGRARIAELEAEIELRHRIHIDLCDTINPERDAKAKDAAIALRAERDRYREALEKIVKADGTFFEDGCICDDIARAALNPGQ